MIILVVTKPLHLGQFISRLLLNRMDHGIFREVFQVDIHFTIFSFFLSEILQRYGLIETIPCSLLKG